jgi:GNAT superfamily N-acetyltransferase
MKTNAPADRARLPSGAASPPSAFQDRPFRPLSPAPAQRVPEPAAGPPPHRGQSAGSMSIFGPRPTVSAGAATNAIQRVVLFYWNPAADSWGAYENDEEPVGHTIYQGQPSEFEFDWDRWRDDPAYKQWWQEQLGGAPAEYQENAPQDQAPEDQAPAVAAPALVFGAPAAIAGGYLQIDASFHGAVVGRARYSAAERPIPGGNQSGIELSEVFVEADQRNHGYSTLILNHVLQVIGLDRKVWLDAQSQGGLSQADLVNWYGRHGFEATGNGNIMATVDFL